MFVLFVDILGFAAQAAGLSDEDCSLIESSSQSPTFTMLDAGKPTTNLTLLFFKYAYFHTVLRELIDAEVYFSAERKHSITFETISFSDSAFLISNHYPSLHSLARLLIVNMYKYGIPVRGGIAEGPVFKLNFVQEFRPLNGMFCRYPFSGPGIVRAYRAESCGLKGPRIFVHPSIMDALMPSSSFLTKYRMIRLPEDEANTNASHEIALLEKPKANQRGFSKRSLLRYLASMQNDAPASAMIHYEAARRAINRM